MVENEKSDGSNGGKVVELIVTGLVMLVLLAVKMDDALHQIETLIKS